MISATFNAPREAFDDPTEPFFEGMSMDDLLRPVHLNAKFFDMKPLPSFGAFDVMKAPQVEADLSRFDAHLDCVFAEADHVAA
jgi:modulator of drug activity B